MSPLCQLFSGIKNAWQRKKTSFFLPFSKTLFKVLLILQSKGYIYGFKRKKNTLSVFLKYYKNQPAITYLKRISTPGHSVFCSSCELYDLRRARRGQGTHIVFTSKGILSDDEAERLGLGGYLLCYIF